MLTLLAAVGAGGRITDPAGAIVSLVGRPFGRAMVGALAIGLALYAGWRFLEAFADANRVGRGRSGIAERAAWALSGAAYSLMAFDAGRIAFRVSDAGGDLQLPRTLVGSPLSRWLVTTIAIGIVAYGVKEARRALSDRFSERLNLRQLSREAGPIVIGISRAGILARALVLAALGLVLLRARTNPARAAADTDMSDSLRLIAALPSGPRLLALVAAGLIAYGVYQLVHARYRKIQLP